MSVEGVKFYHRPVILNKENLKELGEILRSYGFNVTYKVTLCDRETEGYTDISKLTRTANKGKKRIRKLEIIGTGQGDVSVRVQFFCFWYQRFAEFKYPVKCQYVLPSVQRENDFISHLSTFVAGISEGYAWAIWIRLYRLCFVTYTILGVICYLLSWLSLLPDYYVKYYFEGGFSETISRWKVFIFLVLFFLIDSYIVNPLWLRHLFPPVNFMWGAEEKHCIKCKERRKNIVWNIFIGLLVSMFGTFLLRILWGL